MGISGLFLIARLRSSPGSSPGSVSLRLRVARGVPNTPGVIPLHLPLFKGECWAVPFATPPLERLPRKRKRIRFPEGGTGGDHDVKLLIVPTVQFGSPLFLISHKAKGAGGEAFESGPATEGVFAAMGDPELVRVHFADGVGEFIPVGMI